MVEIYASLACAVLGETSSTGRCAQLTTLCHLYNWHLHVREWQRHQSGPCFWEIRQRISRAHPERFASTVSLMPASAPALMEHIMPQIMESYTAAVDPIWMWCYSLNKSLQGRASSFGFYGKILISSAGVRGAFHDWMPKWSIISERIKTCLCGWKCRTNNNTVINRTMQSAEASEQVTTSQWLNLYKCILLLVQILGYWIHWVGTNCHSLGWWLNISFFVVLFFAFAFISLAVNYVFPSILSCVHFHTRCLHRSIITKLYGNSYLKSNCRKHNAFFHILKYYIYTGQY